MGARGLRSRSGASLDRPDAPDSALLSEALGRLAELDGLEDASSLGWRIERRMERRRSTVFFLRVLSSGRAPIPVFYKAIHRVPTADGVPDESWTESLRAGMARSREMTDRFLAVASPEGIGAPRVLAADPGRLAIVTLGVAGRPLGKAWRLVAGQDRASRIFKRIGRAIRLMEGCSPAGLLEDRPSMWRVFDSYQKRVGEALAPEEVEALQRRLEELYRLAISDPEAIIYAHGDLSQGNVLVSGDRVNLVDLQWLPRLRGYDLANLVYRMENESPRLGGWTARLHDELLAGYGDPDISNQPGWQFARLQWLVKLSLRNGRPGQRAAALAEIRASL